MSYTISFRIVEPMLFRAPGEFDPTVRGTYSSARSLTIPLPSTIAGALATSLISLQNRSPPSEGSWEEKLKKVLGQNVIIRGPFLMIDDELYAELSFKIETKKIKIERPGLLNLDEIKELCELALSEGENERKITPKIVMKESRTGIMLSMREEGTKRAKVGFLFDREFITYAFREGFIKKHKVEIVTEIKGIDLSDLKGNVAVRLGGEERIAFMGLKNISISQLIKERLWGNKDEHEGRIALFLATPALFKGGTKIREQIKFEHVHCESYVISAGFDIQQNRRKPIYSALKPGSILSLGKANYSFEDLFWYQGLGEASNLGFGTMIPVPIK